MNPDLLLEVPDTPDRISRSVEILPNPTNPNPRSRYPNLSLKHRIPQSSIPNSSSSPAPNNNTNNAERKRKSESIILSPDSSDSDRNKRAKSVMQENPRAGPSVRDNKGKGKLVINNNEGLRERSPVPVPVRSGANVTPRRVGKRWLVRNGRIAPCNVEKGTGGSSAGGNGDGLAGQDASDSPAEPGRTGGPGPHREVGGSGPRIKTGGPGLRRESGGPVPRREVGGPGLRRENGRPVPRREVGGPGPRGENGGPGPQSGRGGPGARSETGGRGSETRHRREDASIDEIVAGDLYERIISRRPIPIPSAINTDSNTNTTGWRTTANHQSGASNQNVTAGSSRSNPVTSNHRPGASNQNATAGSSSSNPVTAPNTVRPQPPPVTPNRRPRVAGQTSNPTRNPARARGRGRPAFRGESSSSNPARNGTGLTTLTQPRGRVVGVRVSEPVIDLDTPGSSDPDLVRARQLAHDEWLARQLQDEFNSEPQEGPGFSVEELDARIAMSLQQEENDVRAMEMGRGRGRGRGRGASLSPGPGARRPGRGRGGLVTYLQQVQAHFNPSAVHDRVGAFDPNNYEYLLALEENYHTRARASRTALRAASRAQMVGAFDPNNYEALLALDENNHMHTGASRAQINTLPESVVQTDYFEEPCAVCLEKPEIGDTIRHLPCFHKFHKDCIDMWLQRKKECPICKFSIN